MSTVGLPQLHDRGFNPHLVILLRPGIKLFKTIILA